MAVSTTLKLPEDLKARIAPLAQASKQTPHAWMLEALEKQAAQMEQRADFVASAQAAADAYDQDGVAYSAEDVHAYLRAKLAGSKTRKPKPVRR
ncbi:MAG TPA: hypothetical protein VFW68_14815 [Rhodocyclaceae bacterium]|nr:hypothetical protein [Rhodocyclaceae bacterium]